MLSIAGGLNGDLRLCVRWNLFFYLIPDKLERSPDFVPSTLMHVFKCWPLPLFLVLSNSFKKMLFSETTQKLSLSFSYIITRWVLNKSRLSLALAQTRISRSHPAPIIQSTKHTGAHSHRDVCIPELQKLWWPGHWDFVPTLPTQQQRCEAGNSWYPLIEQLSSFPLS